MAFAVFFILHWQLSVFCQSFFLHRYGAHKQFTMAKGWERFFYLLTYVAQGPGFLDPRGYAILHRMHHAYSDTEKDPHSPLFATDVMSMMWKTKGEYDAYAYKRRDPEARFEGNVPEWRLIDRLAQFWPARILWIGFYALVYFAFAPSLLWWALFPVTLLMGPVHGAIVNWCGHKYGYQNFDNGDASRNTLFFDFLTAGELFQNNHHKFAMSPDFAARKWEVDPTYFVVRILAALGIIKLKGGQRMRYPADEAVAELPAE
jgi:stearoyl-CoA desaturase (delta-9 desaturase)